MANLQYPPFASNLRIQKAAENNPPIRPGDPNAEAVRTLQQGILDAGFSFQGGADGKFGPATAAAVVAIEIAFGLGRDAGVAGREVITKLDEVLTLAAGKPRIGVGAPAIGPAELRIIVQLTKRVSLKLQPYFDRASQFLAEYSMWFVGLDKQKPPLDFDGTYDARTDMKRICEASLKHTPGMRNYLRIILADFEAPSLEFGATEGARRTGMDVAPFIILNATKMKPDHATLLHEMIHAAHPDSAGETHDSDQSSVFSTGDNRTVFKSEHALMVADAYYATRKG